MPRTARRKVSQKALILKELDRDSKASEHRRTRSGASVAPVPDLARSVLDRDISIDNPLQVEFFAYSSEIVAFRLLATGRQGAKKVCRKAFDLLGAVLQKHESRPGTSGIESMRLRTRAAAFGVIGGLRSEAGQLLKDVTVDTTATEPGWDIAVEKAVLAAWQLLLRNRGREDMEQVKNLSKNIRSQQETFEPGYLKNHAAESDAWKLVASYHLLRAAELFAEHPEHGTTGNPFAHDGLAEFHFDSAREAVMVVKDEFLFMVRLLELVARDLAGRASEEQSAPWPPVP